MSEKQRAEVTQEIREAAHQLIHECLNSESLVVDTTAQWLADFAAEVERKARLDEAKKWRDAWGTFGLALPATPVAPSSLSNGKVGENING